MESGRWTVALAMQTRVTCGEELASALQSKPDIARRPLRVAMIALLLFMAVAPTAAHSAVPRTGHRADAHPFRRGVVLVGFRRDTSVRRQRAIVAAASAVTSRSLAPRIRVLNVPAGRERATARALRRRGGRDVRFAEPDYLMRETAESVFPNDPFLAPAMGVPQHRTDRQRHGRGPRRRRGDRAGLERDDGNARRGGRRGRQRRRLQPPGPRRLTSGPTRVA